MTTAISNGESGSSVRSKLNDIWAKLELNEIDTSIADTAVDVFVYDTSKDSDGGAWRKRCQHTSWYNEPLNTATRGARREFPAVAVIVAEVGKVTIYDGDDPSLPMWMVFEPFEGNNAAQVIFRAGGSGSHQSITAINGVLAAGMTQSASYAGGLRYVRFIADDAYYHDEVTAASDGKFNGNIAQRNVALGFSKVSNWPIIVNRRCNDVAMTVLPDAPIDPATGLPVPTIAVATAGGVSVIKDDGNIWDITGTNWGGSSKGLIFDRGTLYFMQATYYWLACDVAGLSQDYVLPDGYQASNDNYPFQRVNLSERIAYATALRRVAAGGSSFDLAHPASTVYPGTRLVCHKRGVSGGPNLVAYTTTSYNTGWLPGVIRGAFLADTDDADLVATDTISDRSVNGLTLTLGDSCTVAAVATGADLVGYTFASAETATLGTDISSTGALIWWEEVSGVWHCYVNDLSGGTDYDNGAAGTAGTGLTISGTTLTFAASKKMALARATATIPTADQIKKIYDDEKVLFQDGAQATLYGASDAVTALAHDPDTGILSVGTSAGRSDFQGLRRVDNTTRAVTTAISAQNGLVIEQ